MRLSHIAHVDRIPRTIGPHDILTVTTEQHRLNMVLPGPSLLLMACQDRSHVVAGAAGNCIPSSTRMSRVGKGTLSNDLAYRVSLTSRRRTVWVLLIRVPALKENRPSHELLHILFRDDGGYAGSDDHTIDRAGSIDTVDDVITNTFHIAFIVIAGHVREMRNAVTPLKDLIKASRRVKIRGMQGQAATCMTGHGR